MNKTLAFLLVATISVSAYAGAKKKKAPKGPPPILTSTSFNQVPVGASKGQAIAKGFVPKDVKVGDYLVIHECRKPVKLDTLSMEGYVLLNSSASRADAIGCDMFFDGREITPAQDYFYKMVTVVQTMLGAQPANTNTPDTYLALTNFNFPKTVVSCYLYSDDRTKPPKLRCGVEVRARK
jgi:hypothetical protein